MESYLKLSDIVRTQGSRSETLLPISRSTWLNGVSQGRFPSPTKLLGINVWRRSDIEALMEDIGQGRLSQ